MRRMMIGLLALVALAAVAAAASKPDAGPGPTVAPGIYYPAEAGYVTIYYSNGVPFAAVEGDSAYYLLTLASERIGRATYLRLWLLYRNKAAEPFLLEPAKVAKVTLNAGDRMVDLLPVPAAEPERTRDSVRQAAIRAAGENGTSAADNAKPVPAGTAAWEPSADPGTGAFLGGAYYNSQAGAPLRRHTVFRDKGVAGYLYFKLPQLTTEQAQRVTLLLYTPDGQKLLRFGPQEGE